MNTNNKKLNIFFAASPLHLICINEFKRVKKINEYKLILFLHKGNSHALKQIYLTLEKLKFKNYSIFWIPKNKLIRFISEIFLIIKLKINSINRSLQFILIDFRNIFMQSLRRFFYYSDFILIDDGFYTFVAHQNYMSKDIFIPVPRVNNLHWRITKLIYFGNSFRSLINKPLKTFTIYADEINNDLAEKNELKYLKSLVNQKNRINYNEVYFIGTQMVERGALTLDQELLLVKTANEYWKNKGIKMYYIGKRSTSKEKLEIFKKNEIMVKQFELPLELILIEENNLPGNFCTLGSTLQKSLSIIFGNKINFYFINLKEFFKLGKNKISNIKLDEVDYFATKYSEKSSQIKTINLN